MALKPGETSHFVLLALSLRDGEWQSIREVAKSVQDLRRPTFFQISAARATLHNLESKGFVDKTHHPSYRRLAFYRINQPGTAELERMTQIAIRREAAAHG